MVTIIPNKVERIWETWNVRGAILLSFSIQMFLVLFAPLRKRSDNKLVQFSIWSAYLLADWAANFSIGLITSYNGNNNDSTKDNLMALWAPFLLLHFGGPDTITAFTLEDNLLWLRQILGLLFKVVALGYVFVVTLPQNTLWAPTLLTFVAGIIKYSERTCALYVASNNILEKKSKQPILPNVISTNGVVDNEEYRMVLDKIRAHAKHAKAIRAAYRFKDIVQLTDMKPLGGELKRYCYKKNFEKLADKSHIEALEVIEVLCEVIYEMYYTKASILHNKVPCLVRFVAFSSVVVALGLFTSMEKNGSSKFDKVDVVVTYALFYGALFIETISLFRVIFSEWMVTISNESSHNNSYLGHVIKFYQVKVLKPILILQRSRWSKCKKAPYTNFEELSTPFLFRKWCGSILGLNLITICLGQCHPKKQYLHFKLVEFLEGGFDQIAPYFGVTELELSKYKVKSAFFLDMWQFIFADLIIMKPSMFDGFTLEQRIRLALKKRATLTEEHTNHLVNDFLKSNDQEAQEYAFDRNLMLLNVTTDLCYADDEHNGANKCHLIKLLSNYMLYLLLTQPDMMSEVPGIEQNWFQDTYVNAIIFLKMERLNTRDHESIEKKVQKHFHARAEPNITTEKSLLFHACRLAEHLNNEFSQDVKWEVIGTIWVQMLSFVAVKCRPSIHVQQLSKGGGLISLVWLGALLLQLQEYSFF